MRRFALVTLLVVGCGSGKSAPRSAAWDRPIDFVLPTLDGKQLGSRDLRGNVVLLDFWATWCEPCKDSLPFYQSLAASHGAKGLRVVAVNLDEEASDAKEFVTEHALTFDVLLDPEGSLASRLDLPAMPTLLLLDRVGNVVWHHAGFKARDKKAIKERIDAALAR